MGDQLTYDDLYRIRLELISEIDRLKDELKEGEDCDPKIGDPFGEIDRLRALVTERDDLLEVIGDKLTADNAELQEKVEELEEKLEDSYNCNMRNEGGYLQERDHYLMVLKKIKEKIDSTALARFSDLDLVDDAETIHEIDDIATAALDEACGNKDCENGRILSSNEAGDEYLMRCPDCVKEVPDE